MNSTRSCLSRLSILLPLALIASSCALSTGSPPSGAPARIDAPCSAGAPSAAEPESFPSTFSIAALDPATGDLGIAVASRFLAVGTVVPWVEAGVGAVATQAYANTSFGPRGLELLRQGVPPEECVRRLLEEDPERDFRQLGIVGADGRAACHTGKRCLPWAGARAEQGLSVQGDILVSEKVIDSMARAFRESKGELAERLVTALEAGEGAGGDSRGRQSAALVVSRKKGGYGGFNDRYVDLRVDDHSRPVPELRRLLQLHLGKDALTQARRLEQRGQREEALNLLRDALVEHPGWGGLRFEIARLCLQVDPARGREEMSKALEFEPASAAAHFRAAQILAEAGLAEESLAEIRRTFELNPEFSVAIRREMETPASPLHRYRDSILAALEAQPPAPKP